MSAQFKHCKIYRTSDRSEIKSMLEQNSLNFSVSTHMLIGSRAARKILPNFRGISNDENADWDMISSSEFLLKWLDSQNKAINTIDMIVPLSNDDDQLDLYVYCTLNEGSKYDFSVPRSSKSYTAYILNNLVRWIKSKRSRHTASAKLLLILKKYMLYYSHQWEKTAKDYREFLTITTPLTADDMELCNLFIRYNEKIHGKRSSDFDEFSIKPIDTQAGIIIRRNEFFQDTKDKQISFIYQVAMSLSYCNDILIGLEHICTQGPLWLADYVIENWIDILQEKFKYNTPSLPPSIQIETENYRLFPDIPEIATKRILHFITDTADFYSMQLVCKQWYGILREEIFWRDLYTARYGSYSGQSNHMNSWKMLYLIRMEGKFAFNINKFDQLIDATRELKQYRANDIFKLWEDLTHQDQPVKPVFLAKINYVLSNSFYYQIDKTSEEYSVRLIIIGLENECSRSKVYLNLRVGEYGSSRFTDHMEQLSIQYESSNNKHHSLEFIGPTLFGFYLQSWSYVYASQRRTYLERDASTICDQYPSGLLICLLIMMIHPDHRAHFIKYLKNLENHCSSLLRSF